MPRSLNRFLRLRAALVSLRRNWVWIRRGVHVHPTATFSLSSRFVTRTRGNITVGPETLVAFKTLLVSYDPRTGRDFPIRVGRRCFIGGGSLVGPGVTIGDESIVAAGSVVLSDVPPRSIVAGNPASVIRTGIEVGPYGRLAGADENSRRMWA